MYLKEAFSEALEQAKKHNRPMYLVQGYCEEDVEIRTGGLCDNTHYVRVIVFPTRKDIE